MNDGEGRKSICRKVLGSVIILKNEIVAKLFLSISILILKFVSTVKTTTIGTR